MFVMKGKIDFFLLIWRPNGNGPSLHCQIYKQRPSIPTHKNLEQNQRIKEKGDFLLKNLLNSTMSTMKFCQEWFNFRNFLLISDLVIFFTIDVLVFLVFKQQQHIVPERRQRAEDSVLCLSQLRSSGILSC